MNRHRFSLGLIVAIFALAVSTLSSVQETSADTSRSRQKVFVVAEGTAVRLHDVGIDYTRSLVGLVSTLHGTQQVRFVNSDNPSAVVGPFLSTDANFNSVQDEIESSLLSAIVAERSGLDNALAEVFATLGKEKAAQGSSVYVIGGSSLGGYYSYMGERLKPMAGRFGVNGWTITGLQLPGTSVESRGMLEVMASLSGGRAFELSVPDGFKQLTDEILSQGAKGSLAAISESVVTHRDLMTSVLSVAPGTRETTLVFYKESTYGSLRLSNPSGFEVSAGDRKASYVVETPHVVLWRLVDPIPGNWKIDARRIDGIISAWEYSDNKYTVEVLSTVPLILGEPDMLVAFVADGGNPVAVEGVRMRAYITTPDGATLTQDLLDDGTNADGHAGDGYFSAMLPPLQAEGDHKVELEMRWIELNHKIMTQTSFDVVAYPAVEVRPHQLEELPAGERTRVASVFVHVQGEPFPVSTEQISATLVSSAAHEGLLELEPVRLFGGGPTWEYTVYYTPEEQGAHTVDFQMALEYASRAYEHNTRPIVIRSLAPPELEAPVAVVSSAATQRTAPSSPRPVTPTEESELPWLPWILVGALVAGLASFAGFLWTRTRPYGYIYNDRNQPVMDLATVKRHPVLGFLFRSTLRGTDIKLPGLEGVVFRFSGKRVSLRSLRNRPTVRVNNQPVIGEASIEDKTWIGTHGKLYSFLVAPSETLGEAQAAGD